MRIVVRGWGRDQGETEIMNSPLGDADTGPTESYTRGETYLRIVSPEVRNLTKARVSTSTTVRLGGNYLLQVELTRKEIAQLFYKTHEGDMVRMLRSFIEDEESEEHARKLDRLAEFSERRRQRLAQKDEGKQDHT